MNKEDRKDLVEPVTWRYRIKGLHVWHYYDGPTFDLPEPDAYESEPLYAHPPESAAEIDRLRRELEEARKALEPAKYLLWYKDKGGNTDHCQEAWASLRAALRAEEEGR